MLSKITNFINKHPILTSSAICAGYLLSTAGGYPTDNTSEFNNFNNSDYNSTDYLNS